MKRIFLKPKPETIVRFPTGELLPAAGRGIILNSYWRRRLQNGDVMIVEEIEPTNIPSITVPLDKKKSKKRED